MIQVTTAIVFVCLLALAAALAYSRSAVTKAQTTEEFATLAKPIDMTAFANLIDPAEVEYLRSRLSRREFNRLERIRSRVLIEYVGRITHNAGLLIGIAHHLEQDRRSAELLSQAARVRLYGIWVTALLWVKVAVPTMSTPVPKLLRDYEAAQRALPQGLYLS